MILLTAAKMPSLTDKNILADTVELLFPHPDNAEYINAIRNRKNDTSACESLFALALLYEQILLLPHRIDTSKLIFERSEGGKPYFKDSDVKFNLSHSKGYVALSASVGEEVGVDIEASSLPPERALKMAQRYFCPFEIDRVAHASDSFSQIWSEKEAKAKFYGESVGNLLSDEQNVDFSKKDRDIRLHSFKIDNFPISLCTKRNYSTIIFTVQ